MNNKKNTFSEYPDVLTVQQLAAMLRISTKVAYKLVKEGKIKSIRIGRNFKIAKVFVLDYLEIPH
ncbi:MAG: helix-turn-helix domain-containing protein [Lachnospiraceae bacterium]|nr:helix-turn-helix domain-containing protein [Lachnospiraceae bacterium]MBR4059227.1 helix-turn-helix domain-containing protein [Lachnospiraceae bacterium]